MEKSDYEKAINNKGIPDPTVMLALTEFEKSLVKSHQRVKILGSQTHRRYVENQKIQSPNQ